jgi:hypothetical protein
MNLIFVNEYFHTGTTPSLSSTPKSLEQGGKSFLNVLKKWMESVKAPTENKTFMEVITAFLKKDGSKILNPGQFGADLLEIIQSTGAVYSVHVSALIDGPSIESFARLLGVYVPGFSEQQINLGELNTMKIKKKSLGRHWSTNGNRRLQH